MPLPPFLLAHPAPVRFVPRRGRVVRLAYDRLETSVRLREVAPADIPRIGAISTNRKWYGRKTDLHLHDGELYVPVYDRKTDRAWAREQLGGFLSGRQPRGRQERDEAVLAAGSPLCVHRVSDRGVPDRGEPIPEASIDRIVADGRERARADAVEWVRRNLVAADGAFYRRLPNLMAYHSQGSIGDPEYQVLDAPHDHAARCRDIASVVDVGALPEHLRVMHGAGPDARPRAGGLELEPDRALPPTGADHLDLCANVGLSGILYRHATLLDALRPTLPEADRAAIGRALAAVEPFSDLARIGSLRPGETLPALAALSHLLRTTLARVPEGFREASYPHGWCEPASRYLDVALLPAFAPPVPPEDGAALGALAGP